MSERRRRKACAECRQQKLRCDAYLDYSRPCSRCYQMGVSCALVSDFKRVKRPTKADLRQEITRLQRQLHTVSSTALPAQAQAELDSPPLSSPDEPAMANAMPISAGSQEMEDTATAVRREESYTGLLLSGAGTNDTFIPPTETKRQVLDDVEITPEKINDCFALFFEHYCPLVPVLDVTASVNDIAPNTIYQRCPLLFWMIITVSSRKYYEDPTIFSRLSSRIVALAFRYIAERLTPLHTVEALILLCAWPVPVTHMSRETTHTIAGAALQLALQCGLHIVGEGQEFARTYIGESEVEKRYRANLWYHCLIVCQSASIADGLPPLNVMDSFNFPRGRKEVTNLLSSRLLFQTQLHRIQVTAVFQIMQCALGSSSDSNAVNALVDAFDSQVHEFKSESCDHFGDFTLNSTRLHIAALRLMVNPNDMDHLGIIKMYSIARIVIERAMELDRQIGFSVYSTFYHLRSLLLAASLILKISRSPLSAQVDLVGGERSYFSVIQFARQRSVEPSDLDSRVVTILTQLWSSRTVFRDARSGNLSLRLHSRLTMNAFFDAMWWWRHECNHQKNPFLKEPPAISEFGQSDSTVQHPVQFDTGVANVPNAISIQDTTFFALPELDDLHMPFLWTGG